MDSPCRRSKFAVLAAVILTFVFAVSCAGPARAADGPTSPNPVLERASLSIGPTIIRAELARTADQRERGLMFRKTLAEGEGMLFLFDTDQMLDFWMKNTSLPLSIAWIGSDGIIKGISDLVPFSLAPVSSERSVRYALEAPQGWFGRAGVKVGDQLELPGR